MTIAVTTAMKIKTTVHSIHVHQMNSDATMDVAFSRAGNVITKTIVKTAPMKKDVFIRHVLMVNSLV